MTSDAEDLHPPMSPPRTAERMFGLGGLDTQNISAAALASQIRAVDRTGSSAIITSNGTIATGSFCTAREPPKTKTNSIIDSDSRIPQKPPSDILATNLVWGTGVADDLSTDSGLVQDDEEIKYIRELQSLSDPINNEAGDTKPEINVDTKDTKQNPSDLIVKQVAVKEPSETKKSDLSYIPELAEEADSTMGIESPVSEPRVEDEQFMQVDAAETIYDKAKDFWSWGRGLPVVSPFLGIAEGVAGKFIGVTTGQSLESLDRAVTDQLQIFDDAVLNPVIAHFVHAVLKASSETEKVLKPYIMHVFAHTGLIKTKEENPELTTVAGVTVVQG